MIYLFDVFAGAGGTTTGAKRARHKKKFVVKVLSCINHNPVALASHELNHPECDHITEDVKLVNLAGLLKMVNEIRANDPLAKIGLWGSPDCKGHSRANANKEKKRDLRSLPNALIRYIKVLKPDFIQVENVPEFVEWGPMRDKKVIKRLKGTYYMKWRNRIESLGYKYDHRFLNAADFGGYTSRTRYFGMFVKDDMPIVFPKPTHSKRPSKSLFDETLPWKPVKEVLDLEDEGISIFKNRKIRSDKTFRRIYLGCKKYLPNKQDRFMVKYHGKSTTADINLPASTLTTKDRLAIVKVDLIDNQYGDSILSDTEKPLGALCTNPKQEVIQVEKFGYLLNPQYNSKGRSIDDPCFTLIARMDKMPPELVTVVKGRSEELKAILKKSTGYKAKLIRFMLQNGIRDIKKRMLTIPELLRIQGFGDQYKLVGNQGQQKEAIGNAVHPIIPEKWFEAIAEELDHYQMAA